MKIDEATIEEIRRRTKAYAQHLRFEYGTTPPDVIAVTIRAMEGLVEALCPPPSP